MIPHVGSENEASALALETIMQVQAGGPVEASRHGGDCRGHVGFAPHFRVVLEDARPVRFMAQGNNDLTIVVRGPSGQWWCNDDSDGLNPMVELSAATPGTYPGLHRHVRIRALTCECTRHNRPHAHALATHSGTKHDRAALA